MIKMVVASSPDSCLSSGDCEWFAILFFYLAIMKLRIVENRALVLLVALVTLATFWMLGPFLMPLFWAIVLAVIFRTTFLWWNRRLGDKRNTAAALTLLSAILLVVAPLALIGYALVIEIGELTYGLRSGAVDVNAPLRWIETQAPLIAEQLGRFGIDQARVTDWATTSVATVSQYIAGQLVVLGQNTAQFGIMFFLMMYILFFFVRDGDKLLDRLIVALPLGDDRERRLFERFVMVSRATVKGTLLVAAIQGALGGILFWIVGIQAAVLWGVVMAVLSILPAVGTILVWGPGAIYLFAVGNWVGGIVVLAGGFLVVSLVDNILRPILVGRDAKMPDWIVLVSTLGGIVKFGLSGFVAGPMLAALFLVVWDLFAEEFSQLDSNAIDPELEPDPGGPPGPGDPPIGAEDADPDELPRSKTPRGILDLPPEERE